MVIVIIGVVILGLAIVGFLTYVGVDSVVQNKKEAEKKTDMDGLYRVRAYPLVYKEGDSDKKDGMLSACILHQDGSKQKEVINKIHKKGGEDDEKQAH